MDLCRWNRDGSGGRRRLDYPRRRGRARLEEISDIQFGDWVNEGCVVLKHMRHMRDSFFCLLFGLLVLLEVAQRGRGRLDLWAAARSCSLVFNDKGK